MFKIKNVVFFIVFFVNLYCLDIINEISLKLQKINYTTSQIQQVIQYVEGVKNILPYSVIINPINEASIKKIPFEKFFPVFKNNISNSLLAKELISKVTTKNFQPKDLEYSIILTTKILDSKVTEEEYIKFMMLLSNNFSFEDALYMVNYYSVFKKYFSLPEMEFQNKKIKNPSEILFLMYSNRSVRDMSLIIQCLLKYFSISRDEKKIFEILFMNSSLPTNKLIKKIQNLCNEKIKEEIKQEVQLKNIGF